MTALDAVLDWSVLVLCGLNAGLLLKLYVSHRSGKMPLTAAVGSTILLIGVAWNHAHFAREPGVLPGSVIEFVGLVVMLAANLRVMRLTLFKHRHQH